MNLIKVFEKIFERQKNGEYENIYIMIDIHNTILEPSFDKNKEEFIYLPYAETVLRKLTKLPYVKLIMWTSSHDERTEMYLNHFRKNEICFNYINTNPEIKDEAYACFKTKFYYDIGIDDKFGFEADKDWYEILQFLNNFEKK